MERAGDLPATTPLNPKRQALFGFSVAVVYAVPQMLHLVYGLFFALIIVCAIRGASLHIWASRQESEGVPISGEQETGPSIPLAGSQAVAEGTSE